MDELEMLHANIRTILERHAEQEALDNISAALKDFGCSRLYKYLASLVTRQGAMEDLASRSYLHGNGFYKILLADLKTHVLRLHVWRRNASAEENLHSHRWPFASAIMLGSLTSELWVDAVGEDRQTFPELMYRGKNDPFESVGQCRIRLKNVVRHVAGDYYSMSADELHRIVNVGDQLTVTLMMRPHNTRSWARNILINETVPNAKPVYVSAMQLRAILDEVLEALIAMRDN